MHQQLPKRSNKGAVRQGRGTYPQFRIESCQLLFCRCEGSCAEKGGGATPHVDPGESLPAGYSTVDSATCSSMVSRVADPRWSNSLGKHEQCLIKNRHQPVRSPISP